MNVSLLGYIISLIQMENYVEMEKKEKIMINYKLC